MSKLRIQGENAFQILSHSFAVSPSTNGYTLQYSANGEEFTDWEEATPANETLVVNGLAKFMFFKLKGNSGYVDIQY